MLPRLVPQPKRVQRLPGSFDLRKCTAIRIDHDAGIEIVEVAKKIAARVAVIARARPEIPARRPFPPPVPAMLEPYAHPGVEVRGFCGPGAWFQ